MSYLVFSPYWNVPYNILRRELYPKIAADPNYIEEHHFEIVDSFGRNAEVLSVNEANIARLASGDLKLRQKPGKHNALGEAKFMFPNHHAVYMHGTPAKRLFAKDKRDFSHGCIRLEDPPRLAEHVLSQEPGWDKDRIDELLESGENTLVGLSKPLDVYLVYGTAVTDPDGTVRFMRDVYGHDKNMARLLGEQR
jgi:murein L,D-transpeptidase YcbB/YkuD